MKKKLITTMLVMAMTAAMITGCGSSESEANQTEETDEEAMQTEESVEEEIDEEAVKAEEEAAKLAEAKKYYEKGRAALYGTEGTEINLEEAYNNFEQAKELGYTDANFYLGLLCDAYSYPKEDFEAAKAYYEACKENSYAQISLAFLYYKGQGVEEDKEKAKEMFQTVIDQGCVEGYLGTVCFAMEEEDYTTAFDDSNKVLEGTEQCYIAYAMKNIGVFYENGVGVEPDYGKAMEWYEKAADLGNLYAMRRIGNMYYNGNGVEQDYAKAMEWYEKVADLGDTNAMADIGNMYYNGNGVEQDYARAMEWYEKAADLGNSTATMNVAYMYQEGQGAEQDYAKAMEWYEKAAELGQPIAMNNIGYLYYSGQGVEQDYAKALEWYEKAAELGNEEAKENAEAMRELLPQ
ncbi:MAG: tetratricopeptide repeat protein [Lachnospiraceae bacterium]